MYHLEIIGPFDLNSVHSAFVHNPAQTLQPL